MANSVYDYALSEASSSTTGGWNTAENQDPATVNDGMRAHKQNVAGYLDDEGAVNTVAGTGDVITITTGQPFTAYGTGAGQIGTGVQLRFIAGAANTTNVTLNVNGIGAKAIRKISGGTDVALVAGDLAAGETYTLIYRSTANSAAGAWVLISISAATTFATNAQAQVGTDTGAPLNSANLASVLYKGTDNSGGATITMGDGGYFNLITSTTAITAFAFTNDAIGRTARIRFNTVRTLTYNATSLIIPGAANVTTAAGDIMQIRSLGSGNFVVEWYTRAAAASTNGMVLLTSGTVASAATLDIVLTSFTAYSGIVIYFNNVVSATDAVALYMRVSTNGGSSYDASASDYKYALYSSTSVAAATFSTADTMIQLSPATLSNVSSEGSDFIITIPAQTDTSSKPKVIWQMGNYASNDNPQQGTGVGIRNAAQDTDAVRLLCSSGNIASATYRVYGLV